MKTTSTKTVTVTSAEFKLRAKKIIADYVAEQIAAARARAERLAAIQSGELIAHTVRVASYTVPSYRVRSHERVIATRPKESLSTRAGRAKLTLVKGGAK